MRRIFRTNFRSFYLLNATQFLGALNDNIFKFLVIFLLINVQGAENANTILSLAGAIFVIPFLLFSSGAGVIADRISKRSIIVFTKGLELVIMTFACIIVLVKWDMGLYITLFLMATQSAIFGPSKYGIIPELVESKMVSKANGSLTSLTYLAIIFGTLFASGLTDLTNKNFFFISIFCILIAIGGLFTSIGINRTKPGKSTKRVNPIFLYEIYQTVKFSWKIPNLIPCIFGSSFFLFIAAFSQLNLIPFAMQSLGLSEVGGGYLFLVTAVGIAIGAVVAGKLSKDSVEPGISCIAGFLLGILFLLLFFFSSSLISVLLIITLLGMCGGGYAIAFDAFLQVSSPPEKRGQIIAAANFFSFVGVLMASIYLYVISEELGFSAASGFGIIGAATIVVNIFVTGRLSFLFFPFVAKKILKKFKKLKLLSPLSDPNKLIIFSGKSWIEPLLLYQHIPNLMIYAPGRKWLLPWFNTIFASIKLLHEEMNVDELQSLIEKAHSKKQTVCLYMPLKREKEVHSALLKKVNDTQIPLVQAKLFKEKKSKKVFGIQMTEKQISVRL